MIYILHMSAFQTQFLSIVKDELHIFFHVYTTILLFVPLDLKNGRTTKKVKKEEKKRFSKQKLPNRKYYWAQYCYGILHTMDFRSVLAWICLFSVVLSLGTFKTSSQMIRCWKWMPTKDQKISYKVWKSKDGRKVWNTRKHATLIHWDTHIVKFSKSDQIECSLWIYQYYQYKRVAEVFRTEGFAVAWLNLPNPMVGLNCDLSMAWWNWNRIENHCVVNDPECPWNWTIIHVQTSKEVNRLWLVVFFYRFSFVL